MINHSSQLIQNIIDQECLSSESGDAELEELFKNDREEVQRASREMIRKKLEKSKSQKVREHGLVPKRTKSRTSTAKKRRRNQVASHLTTDKSEGYGVRSTSSKLVGDPADVYMKRAATGATIGSQEGSLKRRNKAGSSLGMPSSQAASILNRMSRAQIIKLATEKAHARYTTGPGRAGNLR